MKKYYPEYYKMFSCIADKCPDSCCKKWEIVIDKDTLIKYNKCEAAIGEKIRAHLTSDEDGDCCFSLVDGRCPFLNEQGLCDIHIELGEDFTSEICRNHPRFVEEYEGFTEISLSLSCPEVNRIIMSSSVSDKQYPTPMYNGDDEVLELLIESRSQILDVTGSILTLIDTILDKAADDALDIDLVYIENHPDFDISFIKGFAEFLLSEAEILTSQWRKYLKSVISSEITIDALRDYMISESDKLIRICHYFTYRYYLKAVNDLDIYSRALFIVAVCFLSSLISLECNISPDEASRLLSKETEHNTYNLELMLKFFSRF